MICPNDENKECDCKNGNCKILFEKFAKVLWCNDTSCLYNLIVKEKHKVNREQYVGFEDDVFTGICMRGDVALRNRKIVSGHTEHNDTICTVRSDKNNKFHVDLGTAQSGNNIPDGISEI